MISAYARGAQVLDEPRYLESARRAAKFLRANLYDDKSKLLFRNYRELADEHDAAAWFSLIPPAAAANVVSMRGRR